MYFNRYSGFILVTMMIFLLVASLLAISILRIGIFEDRTSIFYQDKIRSFYKAENLLLDMENKIFIGEEVKDAEVIKANICGITFYRLRAIAEHHNAKSILQSVFGKVGDLSSCPLKPKILSGRQSFLIIK